MILISASNKFRQALEIIAGLIIPSGDTGKLLAEIVLPVAINSASRLGVNFCASESLPAAEIPWICESSVELQTKIKKAFFCVFLSSFSFA